MLKTPEQVMQEGLARAAASHETGSKLLSQKIFEYACSSRASGELEMTFQELAAIAGLGPWQARIRDRLLSMVKEAPRHPPLDGFVTQWSVGDDRVRLKWDVAAPGEAVH